MTEYVPKSTVVNLMKKAIVIIAGMNPDHIRESTLKRLVPAAGCVSDEEIYRSQKREYLKQDAKDWIEEHTCIGDSVTDEMLEEIADAADISLDKNDRWFEAYWNSVEYAVRENPSVQEMLEEFKEEGMEN